MRPIFVFRRARLPALGAALVAAALALVLFLPPTQPPEGRGVADAAGVPGDPFTAAGADTGAAPRVLLPWLHSVADAVEAKDGWVVLDRRNDRIHALDVSGRLRWSAGGEGRGPGELQRPAALTVAGSTLVVADARGTALDRFALTGEFAGRLHLRATDCMGNLVRDALPWTDGTVVLVRICVQPGSGALRIRADRVDAAGAATTLASLPLKDLRRPGADLLAAPVAATRGDTLYLGTTGDRCLRAYAAGDSARGDGEAGGLASLPLVCLPPVPPVPVPGAERRELERALARRPLARALGLGAPTTLPPFDRVFAHGSGVLFRVLTSMNGRELVRVEPGGRAEPLPVPANEHTFVGSRSVLVSWQEVEGTALRIVPLPDGDGGL